MSARRISNVFLASLLACLALVVAPAVHAAVLPATAPLVHLRADVGVSTDGSGNVQTWFDQSAAGGSNDASQGTATIRPALVGSGMNGLPTVRFNGSNGSANAHRLDIAADSDFDTDQFTWFLAAQTEGALPSGAEVLMRSSYASGAGASGGSDRLWATFTSGGNITSHARTSTGGFVGNGASGTTNPTIISAQWAADNSVIQWLNGVAGTTAAGADAAPSGHQFTRIGAGTQDLNADFQGDISEVLVYNTALSAPDRRSVEDYLYDKYVRAGGSTLVDTPLVDNMRLHVTGDAATVVGSQVQDTAGTPQNGTIAGSVGNPSGYLGQALQFSGSDSNYVNFGDNFDPGGDSLSVSFWFNKNDLSGTEMMIGKGNSFSTDVGWSMWMSNDALQVRGQQIGGTNADRFQLSLAGADSGIAAGEWHHMAMVIDRDNNILRAYFDGSDDNWTVPTGLTDALVANSIIDTSQSMYLGRRFQAGTPYAGLIDDLGIWDRALSADEVFRLFAKGRAGVNAAAVPEPSTFLVFLLGGLCLLPALRRKRAAR